MRFKIISIMLLFFSGAFVLSCGRFYNASNSDDKNLDTVVYRVEGMDSISVNDVQDEIDLINGVVRNFAYYTPYEQEGE